MLTRLSSKGQLVIPSSVRKALGLRPGSQFHLRLEGDKIILEPIRASPIETLYGKYADTDFLADLLNAFATAGKYYGQPSYPVTELGGAGPAMTAVPEPGTVLMLLSALAGLLLWWRRRRAL